MNRRWNAHGICRHRAFTQSDQGLHCPLIELLDTTYCMNGGQRPKWYFAHTLDDLNLRILRMFEGIFSLDAVNIIIINRIPIRYIFDSVCWVRWLSRMRVRLVIRRSLFRYPSSLATLFRGGWPWNVFYGHYLPFADSRSAVVSFWRKNVHKYLLTA